MRQIHWTELPRYKYSKQVEPAMLTKAGCIKTEKIQPVGYEKHLGSEIVEVIYDSDYVYKKLAIEFIQGLNINSLDILLKIITTAWFELFQQTLESEIEISTKYKKRQVLSDIELYKIFNQDKIHIMDLVDIFENYGYEIIYGRKNENGNL